MLSVSSQFRQKNKGTNLSLKSRERIYVSIITCQILITCPAVYYHKMIGLSHQMGNNGKWRKERSPINKND